MPLQIGIIGLPNVGKSTLFNALTRTRGAQAANYPFCTIEPNVGIVEVPDERLQKLSAIVHPKKIIPAAIEFVDIAGLVRGASKGEGLGNKFLAAIREVDALCEVVRLFPGDVIHVEGSVDPARDRETVETELCIADLDTLERRHSKVANAARTGDKEMAKEAAVLEKLIPALREGKLAIEVQLLNAEEEAIAKGFQLLTRKPIIYAANVGESELGSLSIETAKEQLRLPSSAQLITISAKIEEDLQDLSAEDAAAFLTELKVTDSGLTRLIHAAYEALGYITFLTAGPEEVRAWNVRKNSRAPQAAGVIHTDFEKGFIRAETIAYNDYITLGGEVKAKEAGKMRAEGKDYVVSDGDVMHFRFNV